MFMMLPVSEASRYLKFTCPDKKLFSRDSDKKLFSRDYLKVWLLLRCAVLYAAVMNLRLALFTKNEGK